MDDIPSAIASFQVSYAVKRNILKYELNVELLVLILGSCSCWRWTIFENIRLREEETSSKMRKQGKHIYMDVYLDRGGLCMRKKFLAYMYII